MGPKNENDDNVFGNKQPLIFVPSRDLRVCQSTARKQERETNHRIRCVRSWS